MAAAENDTAVRRERLLDWVRREQGMPWEGEVVAAVADDFGCTVLEVRADAFGEDVFGGCRED